MEESIIPGFDDDDEDKTLDDFIAMIYKREKKGKGKDQPWYGISEWREWENSLGRLTRRTEVPTQVQN